MYGRTNNLELVRVTETTAHQRSDCGQLSLRDRFATATSCAAGLGGRRRNRSARRDLGDIVPIRFREPEVPILPCRDAEGRAVGRRYLVLGEDPRRCHHAHLVAEDLAEPQISIW